LGWQLHPEKKKKKRIGIAVFLYDPDRSNNGQVDT
jgi:hypothetical protein